MTHVCIPIASICNFMCRPSWNAEFNQILLFVLWCFPMFPNAHTKSVPDITVKFFAECFHTSYLEVVNPPSDKLIELFHLVAVANAPTTASEFSHSVLKLRY